MPALLTTTLAPARPKSSHIAAPMPRLPPVTTATAPCKFKTASLSVEFASEPGESIAVPGPDQTMCTTHLNPATACDLPLESKITLLLSLTRPNCRTGTLQSQKGS